MDYYYKDYNDVDAMIMYYHCRDYYCYRQIEIWKDKILLYDLDHHRADEHSFLSDGRASINLIPEKMLISAEEFNLNWEKYRHVAHNYRPDY
jgi:hypothetical protein